MSTELDLPRKGPSMMLGVCVLTLAYVSGYGGMRCGNVLIHSNASVDWDCPLADAHFIRAGRDLRDTGIGWFKNQIAEPVEVIYSPLCWIEAAIWNVIDPPSDPMFDLSIKGESLSPFVTIMGHLT